MKKKFSILNLLLLCSLLITSCNLGDGPEEFYNDYVIILNQGNYTDQSGSISIYNELTRKITNRAFESANNNTSLGSIIMSGDINKYGNLYLLCSNPDKLMILDVWTLSTLRESVSSELSMPRVVYSDNDNFYITNYGDKSVQIGEYSFEYPESYVAIHDMSSLRLLDTVRVGADAEGMVSYNNKLYVATKEGVTIVDINTLKVVKKISDQNLGAAKYFVQADNKIFASFPQYGIAEIDPSSDEIVNRYEMAIDYYDGSISISPDNKKIYSFTTEYDANWNAVSKVTVLDLTTGSSSILKEGTQFYSIGVNPFTGNIYAADASFTSNSSLYVWDKDHNVVEENQAVGVATYRYLYVRNLEYK